MMVEETSYYGTGRNMPVLLVLKFGCAIDSGIHTKTECYAIYMKEHIGLCRLYFPFVL